MANITNVHFTLRQKSSDGHFRRIFFDADIEPEPQRVWDEAQFIADLTQGRVTRVSWYGGDWSVWVDVDF